MTLNFNHLKKFILSYSFILIGVLLCISFWIIEALLHTSLFEIEDTFLEHLFTIDPHELWMRSIACSFLLFFGVITHYYYRNRNKLIDELEEKNKFINNIFDSIQDGISILDLDLNIIQANHWMEKMYELDSPLIGKKCYSVYQKRISKCPWCPSIKTINTGKMHTEIVPYPSENDIKGWIYVSTFPLMDENNNVRSIIEYIKDITELKKIENDFKDAFNRAEFYKDLFAHDFDNILQNILSSTELSNLYLNKPNSEMKITEFLSIIKNQVIIGSKLISNVRKLSKLEEIKKSIQRIELIRILKKSVRTLKKSYPAKNINLQMDLINDKLYVRANELLNDIFVNILTNAVKYNENSVIEIIIKTSSVLQNGKCFLKLEFIDNGVGIDNIRKEKIFERAYNEIRSVSGMGLGLSLVKSIIDSYDGQIWVENRVSDDYSKGSDFVILIPNDEEIFKYEENISF